MNFYSLVCYDSKVQSSSLWFVQNKLTFGAKNTWKLPFKSEPALILFNLKR